MSIVYPDGERWQDELATDDLILFAITELEAVVVLLPADPLADASEVQP